MIPVSERLIISMYDLTGEWAKPYIEAGYPVQLWDGQIEGDIFEHAPGYFMDICKPFNPDGYQVYGILSATPCTDFAVSGALHFKKKDASTKRVGLHDEFENSVEMHVGCAAMTMAFVDWFQPAGFWTMENPVGRIESLMPEFKPFRKMLFQPCDYGDPYTKKTILWGEFNKDLIQTPVEPVHGSKMHMSSGWDKVKQKKERSTTPSGFARAFFQANQ